MLGTRSGRRIANSIVESTAETSSPWRPAAPASASTITSPSGSFKDNRGNGTSYTQSTLAVWARANPRGDHSGAFDLNVCSARLMYSPSNGAAGEGYSAGTL